MELKELLKVNPHMFDGAGDGAGAEAGIGESAAPTAGPEARVEYGTPYEGAEGDGESATHEQGEGNPPDYDTEFDDFTARPEMKERLGNRIKSAVDRRFQGQADVQSQLDAVSPLIDDLIDIYGVEDGDIGALRQRIFESNDMVEEAAEAAGMTPEQYIQQRDMDRREQEIEQAEAERQRQEGVNSIREAWEAEIPQLEQDYPGFDVEKEQSDPDTGQLFNSLLATPGMSLRSAYEATHLRELMNATAHAAADQARESAVNNIRVRGARPPENGLSNQKGVVRKSNVNELSDADMDEINRRVMRGEKIKFG